MLDSARLQTIGETLHVSVQFGIGQVALFAFLAAPVERHPVAATRENVPVQAVVAGVEPAVGEPLVEGRVAVVENGAERCLPVQPLACLIGPPGRRVRRCLVVYARIAHLRVFREVWRRWEGLGPL